MNIKRVGRWLPLLILPFASAAAPQTMVAPVHGDYVEVRTASVFAGACHYNGERMTEGRSALLAWNIDGGSFDGVDLAGVKVLAAIACEDNLAEANAARRSAFVVDADTDAKASAAIAWIQARCADQLGTVSNVRRAPVNFTEASEAFTITSAGFGAIAVKAMPDRACCSQPELVWYQPLMPIEGRRVGYTTTARANIPSVNVAWQRSDENSAFYGHFSR